MSDLNLIWQTCDGDQTNFEYEYTTEVLFKNFKQNKIFDNNTYNTVLDNSVIIYSNNSGGISDEFNSYLDKFVKNNYTFYLLHFSNEDLNHNCNYYSKAKHVFRNYYDSNIVNTNVTFVPLGVKSGFINKANDYSESKTKTYNASFIGQPKSDRNDLIEQLEKMNNVFIHKTSNWNCSTSLSQQECIDIYRKTKFVPCPMGWCHPDSFRLMECLEWGAIPILKNYNQLDYIKKVWGDTPLPVVESWNEVSKYSSINDFDYNVLQNRVIDWYINFKRQLSLNVLNTIDES